MHFGIVHVTVREVDLAGVYTERDHGCVVNHVPGINDSDQWTIMCVPDGSWRRKLRWKFSTGRSRNNLPVRRKIQDRKSTRLNSSHANISYAVFCLKKKKNKNKHQQHVTRSHTRTRQQIQVSLF